MRTIVTLAMAALSMAALAQERDKAGELTPEQKQEHFLRVTGGYLDMQGHGPAIVLLDSRKTPDNAAARVVEVLTKTYHAPATNVVAGIAEGSCPYTEAATLLKEQGALMAIALVECEKAAALAVFPEDRVAVVNAARFGLGADASEKEARLVREIWRAIGFIGGTGYSSTDTSVMQPISSPIELDTIQLKFIPPVEFMRMRKLFKRYGTVTGKRVTYKYAARNGWAHCSRACRCASASGRS